jgi:sugar phosphate isomerase/epimerase
MNNSRRKFLETATISMLGAPFSGAFPNAVSATSINNLKLSLNAYSFNRPLISGEISLEELFDYCAEQGFRGVDLTAYYLEGYPEIPTDEYLYKVKRQALERGLHISGTGVRNDFTLEDAKERESEKERVKNWVKAAAKLGAPILRVFSGLQKVDEKGWKTMANRMVGDLKECVAFGASHGVVVAMQNHDDFIQTADQVNYLSEGVDSPWYGLVLDIGSYAVHEPYEEIEKNLPLAVSWQIKEMVNHFGQAKPVDLRRLFDLIARSDYHGYLPIETLGPGDPKEKVRKFLGDVREAMSQRGLRAG